MFKRIHLSLICVLIITFSSTAPSWGSTVIDMPEDEQTPRHATVDRQEDEQTVGYTTKFARTVTRYLPRNPVKTALCVELLSSYFARQARISLLAPNVSDQIAKQATTMLSRGQSFIFKWEVHNIIRIGSELINDHILGESDEAMNSIQSLNFWSSFKRIFVDVGSVAAWHYIMPFIEENGLKLVASYGLPTAMSGMANSVGIPITPDMINTGTLYAIWATTFLGTSFIKESIASRDFSEKEKLS